MGGDGQSLARIYLPTGSDDAPVGAGEEIPVGSRGSSRRLRPSTRHGAAFDFVRDLRWGRPGSARARASSKAVRSAEIARAVQRPPGGVEAPRRVAVHWDTSSLPRRTSTVPHAPGSMPRTSTSTLLPLLPPDALPANVRSHMRDWHTIRAAVPETTFAAGISASSRRRSPCRLASERTERSHARYNAILFPQSTRGRKHPRILIGPGSALDSDRARGLPGQLGTEARPRRAQPRGSFPT